MIESLDAAVFMIGLVEASRMEKTEMFPFAQHDSIRARHLAIR